MNSVSMNDLVKVAMLLLPTLSMAQDQSDWSDWTMGARYTVQLELFRPTLDTRLRIDSSDGTPGIIEAETGLTAPLPTFGLTGSYAFTDKLYLRAGAGVFSFDLALSDETNLRGGVAAAKVGIYHNTFENVRFGLAYSYYDVDVSWGNASGFNTLQYNYHGPALSVAATF